MLEQDEMLKAIDRAVGVLASLATVLHDHHRDAFDAALSDLLRLLQSNPSAVSYASQLLVKEFDIPHNRLWQVTKAEYERRKSQVLLAMRNATEHRPLA